jgi:pSer/pThr/pTyr-binding forkhead associated (FHA) protein
MALLELRGKRFPIPAGEVLLGSDASSAIVVTGAGVQPRHAVIQAEADGQVVIRKATPAGEVLINGVRLGAEPTPLLHGDKVEIGGNELTFVDERRSGSTQYVAAVKLPEASAKGGTPRTGSVTANTGGRIVSLTDGREYVIAGASLVFGREAGCDVVVVGKDVSRRHAEIVQTPKGYLLVDSSTNGTFVNEERVQGQRILVRADVLRIGEENFRFYADAAAAPAPGAPPSPGPSPGPAASAPQAAPQGSAGADSGGSGRAPGRPSQAGPLATLLVTGGALKGQRFPIKTPVINLGRADYNDLVLPDPSVSTAHAKIQRREGVWVLVDLDSTNGTFVDGERVAGETPIAPGASVRVGDVPLIFEPTDDALGIERGGGTAVLSSFAVPRTTASAPPAPPPAAPTPPPPPRPPAAPAPGRASPGARAAPKGTASPAAPPPTRAPAKPQPKRPQTPPPPAKQGKGCGASVLVLVGGGAGLAALVHWILA